MHVLILVVLKTGCLGAQLPGIPPLFPLQEPSTFAFDLQPLQSAYHGFAAVNTDHGFGAVAQFVSISTHATCKAQLIGFKSNERNPTERLPGLSTLAYAQSEIQFRLMLNL